MAFGRKYSIAVSDPITRTAESYSLYGKYTGADGRILGTTSLFSNVDANTITQSAKVFEDPTQMTFGCKYTTEGSGSAQQTATLELFNLNEDEKNYFNKSPTYVSVAAGYRDTEESIIYSGQVLDYYTYRSGSDLITTVLLKDSYEAIKNIRVSKTYPSNTGYRQIIEDLVSIYSTVGVTVGNLDLSTITYRTPTAHIVEGYLSDILDEVCSGLFLSWFVSHNKVYVFPGKRGTRGNFTTGMGVIVTSDNITNTIENKNSSATQLATDEENTGGIIFSTFLNPNISIDKYLKVEVEGFEGTYKVTSVEHKLDYRGSDWYTRVEASIIE